jgi:hypothetical protein
MASDTARHDELVRQCLEHLRRLPFVRRVNIAFEVATQRDQAHDAQLSIRTPTGQHVLPCEVRRSHLRKETAELLMHMAKRHPELIVFAPSIGRELGDTLEHAGINFVDAAGNCYLRLGNQYVGRIQGRSPIERARTGRGLRAPAYRVLLALLIQPELVDAPSRTIASEANVSPQTANELRRRLVEQHIVAYAGGHHRWLPSRKKDALSLWLAGFATALAPSLQIGRYRAQERDPAAAYRLTQYYRGDRTLLYVQDPPPDLTTRLRLVRDANGPIILARSPGRLAFVSSDPRCVHPLLAYTDLLAEGEPRAREAALELRERLLPDFEAQS